MGGCVNGSRRPSLSAQRGVGISSDQARGTGNHDTTGPAVPLTVSCKRVAGNTLCAGGPVGCFGRNHVESLRQTPLPTREMTGRLGKAFRKDASFPRGPRRITFHEAAQDQPGENIRLGIAGIGQPDDSGTWRFDTGGWGERQQPGPVRAGLLQVAVAPGVFTQHPEGLSTGGAGEIAVDDLFQQFRGCLGTRLFQHGCGGGIDPFPPGGEPFRGERDSRDCTARVTDV